MRVERVRVPIPIQALGHVNAYIVEGNGKAALVEAGMYWAEGFEGLARAVSQARKGGLCSINMIIVTHFHVDHLTGLPLIEAVCPTEAYMGERDLATIRRGFTGYFSSVLETYSYFGVPRLELDEMMKHHWVPRLAKIYDEVADMGVRPLRGGDKLSLDDIDLRVLEVPGHTPGHIALVAGSIAFTGDSLLGNITPHVILDGPEGDPLGAYEATLRLYASMTGVTAYAGHRDPVPDVASRAQELLEHHRSRLAEVEALLRSGVQEPYEVAKRLRWRTRAQSWDSMSPYERYFAIGETLAHLRRLEVEGRAERVEINGRILFRPAQH